MKQNNKSSARSGFREILALACNLDFRGLFIVPTENGLLQFFRYCFVGGVATIVDWGVLYVTEMLGLHYLLSAVLGFFGGLTCNYFLSKCMVFNGSNSPMTAVQEFLAYAAIGAVGLLITLLLMFVMTEWFQIHFMLSKVVATVLVLIWNFIARKMLYR